MEPDRPGRRLRWNAALRSIADEVFARLAAAFPVCCESDEFYYFPQVIPPRGVWPGWDDFTPDRIEDVLRRLSSAESRIGLLAGETGETDLLADAETLRRLVRTLREQLGEVRFHRTQPTFHLTVMGTGLASALEDPDPRAWSIRVQGLPSFLKNARETLTDMPVLFRDLGVEMIRDTKGWLRGLGKTREGLSSVLPEMDRFEEFLRNARTTGHDRLSPAIAERIVKEHLGCGADLAEVRHTILEEIRGTGRIMEEICGTLFPGDRWTDAIRKIPSPDPGGGGPLAIFRQEAETLLGHCIDLGIVPDDFPALSPLRIAPIPPYLQAVRAASAYSFTPQNPSQKGTFYIVPAEGAWNNGPEDLVDYRMLTAHETYPGHHLLDSWRWHFVSPLRRPVESPLFYEGWACFAEEFMRLTGHFAGPADLLLLAKRRYKRAVRGLVDLDLQTGKRDLGSAATLLAESGFRSETAFPLVRKYALRPGYQVCYAVGLRRFLDLHARYGTNDLKGFVRTVLSGGEIGFDHVEEALRRGFG